MRSWCLQNINVCIGHWLWAIFQISMSYKGLNLRPRILSSVSKSLGKCSPGQTFNVLFAECLNERWIWTTILISFLSQKYESTVIKVIVLSLQSCYVSVFLFKLTQDRMTSVQKSWVNPQKRFHSGTQSISPQYSRGYTGSQLTNKDTSRSAVSSSIKRCCIIVSEIYLFFTPGNHTWVKWKGTFAIGCIVCTKTCGECVSHLSSLKYEINFQTTHLIMFT